METLHNTYYIYHCQEYGYLLQRNAFYKTLKFSDFTLSDLCHYMHCNFSLIQIEKEGGKTHTLLNNGYLQTHIDYVCFPFCSSNSKTVCSWFPFYYESKKQREPDPSHVSTGSNGLTENTIMYSSDSVVGLIYTCRLGILLRTVISAT